MLKWKLPTLLSILTLGIITSGLIAYGAWGSRAAAPQALDAWDLLDLAEVHEEGGEEDWRAVKTFPLELRAAATDFTIEGFVVPVVAQGYIQQFMLVEAPENCPFCGNGSYGPVLEVVTKRPIPDMPEFSEVLVTGTLEFNEATDTFQMFRLVDAELLEMREVQLDFSLPGGGAEAEASGQGG